MSPTPGAGPDDPSDSRRSSGSSQSTTAFATPPSSPKLNTSISRIPKLAPSPVENALSRSSSSGDKRSNAPAPTHAPGPAPPHFPAAPSPSSLPVPVHNKLLARKSMSAAIPHSSRRYSQYVAKNGPSPSSSIPTAIPVFRGGGGGSSSGNVSSSVTPTPSPVPSSSTAATGRAGIGRGASPASSSASAMRRTSSAEGRRAARTHHREGHAPPMPPPLPPGAAPPLASVAGTSTTSSPSPSSGIPRRQKSSSSLGRRKSHIPTSNLTPSPRARPMSVKPPARVSSAAAPAMLSAQHHPPLPTSPPIPNGSPAAFGFPNGSAAFNQDLPLRSASLRATSDSRPASPPPPPPPPPARADATFPPPEPQFRRPDATHSPGQPSTSSVDVDDGHRHVDDHSPARPNGVARGETRPSRSSSLSSASLPASPLARSHGFQQQVGTQATPPKDQPSPHSPRTATTPHSPTTPLSPPMSSNTVGLNLPLRNESLPQTPLPPLATSPTRSTSLAPEPPAALRSSTSSQGSTTTVVPDPIETEVPPLPITSNQAATSPVSTVSSTATPGSPEVAPVPAPTTPVPAPAAATPPVPNGRVTPDSSRNAKASESPRAPRTSPRPDRKSPGLTIDPPPPPASSHNIRVVSPPPIPAPQASAVPPAAVPIIPAKSPLRPRTGRLRSGTNTGAVPPVPKLPDNIPPVPQRPSSVHHVSTTLQLPERDPSTSGSSSQPPASESSGATARAEEANQTTDSATTEEPSAVTTASSTSSEPRTSPSVAVPSQQALAAAILAPVQNTYGGIPLTARSDPAESSAQPFAKDLSSSLLASPIPFDDSGPPSAPASNQNIWVVSSGGSASRPTSFLDASTSTASTISTSVSTTDSLLGRSEAGIMEDATMYDKRESLDDEIISSPTALCDLCPSPTNCPHTTLKKQTSLPRVTPLNLDVHSKVLPELPLPSPNQPLSPRTPTTPARPQHAQQNTAPPRSPSMPTLVRKESPASVASQTTTESHDHLVPRPRMRGPGPDGRSNTTGHSPRPQSMVITGSPLPSPISPSLSRRAHLIREIAHTERTHANDLALITDAYVGRVLRTDSGLSSQGSTAVEADSNASTPGASTPGVEAVQPQRGHARRPSYGLAADEHGRVEGKRHHQERRMSGQDSAWAQAWSGLMSPVLKSPKEREGHHQGNGSMDGMYQSSAGGSSSSFQMVTPPVQSPANSSAPASASTNNGFTRLGGIMNPQSGKPLSSWDIKAVFLNINELAYISDELAKEFDQAIGDADSDSGTPGVDSVGDRLGEVFMKMVSTQLCETKWLTAAPTSAPAVHILLLTSGCSVQAIARAAAGPRIRPVPERLLGTSQVAHARLEPRFDVDQARAANHKVPAAV